MPDSLRDGRYVLLGPLGEGSQGRTFDGIDKREGRPVAIKRFDVRGAKQWKDVELAEREARVLQSLSHAKLPAYIDHFEEEGALYLVMEKIEGESLGSLRKRGAVLSERDVVRLLEDASEVLDYLHGRAPPVIHRDLKPGNVLRRPDGSFAFVDFGAVRDRLRPEGGSTVVGTFGFMAPEQFQGRALPQSDVYAIGATALSLLTGEQPEDLPHKGLAIDVRAALRGRSSEWLVSMLEKMLDPDPDKRPARIGPLLVERERRASAGEWEARARSRDEPRRTGRIEDHARRVAEKMQREIEREVERQTRHADRRERKRAEREARRAARHAEDGRRERSYSAPWPVALVVTLALSLATVVVALTMNVIVPLVLAMLSLAFGASLRRAAKRVQEAGSTATASINRARRFVSGGLAPPRAEERERDEPRVRVVDANAARMRVETPDDAVTDAEHEDEEHAEREAKRRKV